MTKDDESAEPFAYYADGSLSVATYDFVENAVANFAGDVDYYIKLAARHGGPILDLGCGTGRVTWALAEAGFETIGIDLSEAMLAAAEAKRDRYNASANDRVSFRTGDMRAPPVDRAFPLILIPYRSFNHLTEPADQRATLVALSTCLEPDGIAVLHLFDPPIDLFADTGYDGKQGYTVVHPEKKFTVRWRRKDHQVDVLDQTLVNIVEFIVENRDGRIVRQNTEIARYRWLTSQEMRYLAELADLEAEGPYSDFAESPPKRGGEQIWLLRHAGRG